MKGILVTVLLLAGACRPAIRPDGRVVLPDAPPVAEAWISAINQKNADLPHVKGIGKVSRIEGDGIETSRAAWAAAPDGRLRMDFLGLPGQASARLVFNGHCLYVASPADARIYRRSMEEPDLKTVSGVPVGIREVITCLAGGVPVYDHDTVGIDLSAGEARPVLVLKKSWRGVVQKIAVNGAVVENIEVWRWGTLLYRAEFSDHQRVDGRLLPFDLQFFNADRQGLAFQVDRCWAVQGLSPETFEIPAVP